MLPVKWGHGVWAACIKRVLRVVEPQTQMVKLEGGLDADDAPTKDVRIVQFTSPGSACSVTFGKGITPAERD